MFFLLHVSCFFLITYLVISLHILSLQCLLPSSLLSFFPGFLPFISFLFRFAFFRFVPFYSPSPLDLFLFLLPHAHHALPPTLILPHTSIPLSQFSLFHPVFHSSPHPYLFTLLSYPSTPYLSNSHPSQPNPYTPPYPLCHPSPPLLPPDSPPLLHLHLSNPAGDPERGRTDHQNPSGLLAS